MKRESLVYAISFTFFGILVGWILGSQQAGSGAGVPPPSAAMPQAAPPADDGSSATPLDVKQVGELEKTAVAQPSNAGVRVQLGDLYYDAKRFEDAATWYEASLKIKPDDANVSTDLAVCYLNLKQADRALAQIDRSLAIDPKHSKSLLNQGYIRAFGKEDIAGAIKSWQRLIDVAPDSEEAKRAKVAIQTLQANHEGAAAGRGREPLPDGEPR